MNITFSNNQLVRYNPQTHEIRLQQLLFSHIVGTYDARYCYINAAAAVRRPVFVTDGSNYLLKRLNVG